MKSRGCFMHFLPFRAFCVEDLSQIDDVRPLSVGDVCLSVTLIIGDDASIGHHHRRLRSWNCDIARFREKSVYFRCFCGLWALWFRLICFRVICWKKICEDLSVTLIIDDDATIGHHRRSIGHHRRSDIGIAIITNHRDDYNGNPRCSHYLSFEHGTSTQKP